MTTSTNQPVRAWANRLKSARASGAEGDLASALLARCRETLRSCPPDVGAAQLRLGYWTHDVVSARAGSACAAATRRTG